MALRVLEVPITEIDISLGDLHYNDNLVYHYAGGMAFAALKRWEEAEEFFEICVSSPAQVPAAIQLEAYKKLTLVQLISRGTVSLTFFVTWTALTGLIEDCSDSKVYQWFPNSNTEDITLWVICEGIPATDCDVEENRRVRGCPICEREPSIIAPQRPLIVL